MFITVRSSSMFIKFLVDPHLLCSILITSPPAPSAIIAPHIHLLPVAPPAPALVQKAAGGGALKAHLRVPSRSWRMRCFPKKWNSEDIMGILCIKWYGNCKKRGHCRLNFLHQFCTSREGTQQNLLGLHQV